MRILLVEDEPDLGHAIQQVLTQESYIVDWVQDGETAWDYLENAWVHYTVAIVDWLLPGLSGVELCQRLRQRSYTLPVLLLTAKDRLEDKVTGLDAGADDYLVKPFGMPELLARLRALQRRSPQIQPQQLQIGNLQLDYSTRTATLVNQSTVPTSVTLTTKEFQLLAYLMEHPDRVVTSEQLIHQLWEVGADLGNNAVAAQIRLLRRKLAEIGCETVIETMYRTGYRFNRAHAAPSSV